MSEEHGGFATWIPDSVPQSTREWLSSLKVSRKELAHEAIAGVPGAIGSVPDSMASGVLVGVNPVFGLYAALCGRIFGGLLQSSPLMVVTTTSAASLAAASTIAEVPANQREQALLLVVLLSGVFMTLAGLFRLGRYTRFVSQSVMVGFLSGIAINVVCSQLSDLTGIPVSGGLPIQRALKVLTSPANLSVVTLVLGIAAGACTLLFARGRFAQFGALIAIAVPSIINSLLSHGAQTVGEKYPIPGGLPTPQLPTVSALSINVVFGAIAIAMIVLVQGVGVSESVYMPGRPRPDPNRDFLAQGIGNVAASFMHGVPVGGSVSQSALNKSSGARTRWGSIFSGIWLVLVVVALTGLIEKIALTCLAGLLIMAAVSSLKPREVRSIIAVSRSSAFSCVVTFVGTLVLPIAQAVGIGVIVSLLLQLNLEAVDLKIVELKVKDGHLVESPAPRELTSNEVVILDVYGSLFYAGSRTLQSKLPNPESASHAVVVLRMRGRPFPPATFFFILNSYGAALDRNDGKLILSGVDPRMADRIHEMNNSANFREYQIVEATDQIGESTIQAFELGQHWIVSRNP